jgi:hypothetical protein
MEIKKNRDEVLYKNKEHLWNLPYNLKIKLDNE